MSETSPIKVPQKMVPLYETVTELTDAFCREHLTDEYAVLARQAAAALARKRPSPLLQGKPKSWACGIVVALGRVNFLFDSSQELHFTVAELCKRLGVPQSTGSTMAKKVTEALKTGPMDPDWTLPSKVEDNPLAWFVEVNGLIMDARTLPRDMQEEIFKAGLIPSLPPD